MMTTPQKERLAVYIDGFNLYHGLKDTLGRSRLWLDIVKLARSIRPKQELVQVKYFTATVLDDRRAQSRQDHYISALKAKHPTILQIVSGRYQKKEVTCRSCGATHTSYEEKETDVNLAAALIEDAAKRTFDSVFIISADSDMIPAIKAAQRVNPQLFIAAAFPPGRSSSHLKQLLPASFQIGHHKIRKAQLPDEFGRNGKTYRRPDKWS